LLMERWEFPEALREVAALHHREPTTSTPALVSTVYIAWQIADMLGLSPMATRSAATIEEITATLPETARQGIFAGLETLPRMVAKKLTTAESVAA
jgi:HD-like signal output (HDOD) protein